MAATLKRVSKRDSLSMVSVPGTNASQITFPSF